MSPSSARLSRALLLALVAAAASGCAAVKPWERGLLSHPAMEMGAGADDAFRGHVNDVREGSIGGAGGLGGGCGCG